MAWQIRNPFVRRTPEKESAPVSMSAAPTAVRFSTLGWDDFPFWEQNSAQLGEVTREFALSVAPVLKATSLIRDTIAALPLRVLDAENNVIRSRFLERIDPDVENPVTISQIVTDLLFDSIAWLRVLARDPATNRPLWARRIDPSVVSDQPPPGYILDRLPSGFVPGSTLWVAGEPVSTRDMLRFNSTKEPIRRVGARTIRRMAKLEQAAEMYATAPQMRGYFTAREGQDPDQTAIDNALALFAEMRLKHGYGYVPAALEYHTEQQPTPADLQLTTIIEKTTIAVADLFGLDPEDLGVSMTRDTYNNAVDRRQDKKNETYAGLCAAIEAVLSWDNVTLRGQRVVFDWDGYLEPNPTDRATIAQTLIGAKVVTPDEAREDWRRPPLTAAQKAELNPKPEPVQQPDPQAQAADGRPSGQSNVVPIRRPSQASNFSATEPMYLTFSSDVDDAFGVDMKRRTITGLVVPWNEIGHSSQGKYRIAPGALKFNKGRITDIKLLHEHFTSTSVGHAVRTWADEQGQWATFKVGRGPAGDQALLDAADRVRDHFSVGIGFENDGSDVVEVPDPTDPTVKIIVSAPWRETSQVGMPAFAGARVTAVNMSANPTGVAMTAPVVEPQAQPAAQGAAVTFSAEQFAQLMAGLASQAPAAPAPAPAIVNPTALPLPTQAAVTQVREQPLYRFDGNPAQRCFLTDIKNRFGGDATLQAKAEEFTAAAMAKAFAAIAVSDVDELNPVIQRPDLFVPKLTFNRVLGAMTQGGAVTSLTGFKYPKFSADSGLVAAHTPGTEPTEGAVSTTSGDVTPVGLSGLLILQREVIDQGGSPQLDSLLWSLMTQAYAEALEGRVQDLFESLSLSASNVVGVDGILSANLKSLLIALQFIRGGDRYSAFAADSTLYTALAGAVDYDDRPLFPMDAPSNADGSTAGDLSTIRAHGKLVKPAWALESANGGEGGLSYLWAPGSVYQWFSAPRRIDLEIAVATVRIGLWGYSAEFCTRATDVKELAYAQA